MTNTRHTERLSASVTFLDETESFPDAQQVQNILERFMRAVQGGDRSTLESILSEDAQIHTRLKGGSFLSKGEYIDFMTSLDKSVMQAVICLRFSGVTFTEVQNGTMQAEGILAAHGRDGDIIVTARYLRIFLEKRHAEYIVAGTEYVT